MTLTKEEIIEALNERHSPEKQQLLSEGHVAIAGLGGLGSNVASALARIGVGHLHLIDSLQQRFQCIGFIHSDLIDKVLLSVQIGDIHHIKINQM